MFLWPSFEAEQIIYWNITSDNEVSMSIQGKKDIRSKFLKGLYDVTDGSQSKLVNAIKLGEKIGISRAVAYDVTQYLSNEGLLKISDLRAIISITHIAVTRIEK